MQLHQFAGVVFIDAAHIALRLIQVEQHGRVACAGQQQVLKLAQCIGANHIDHIVAHKRTHSALAGEHIEVVEPELGHAGQQRVFHRWVAAGHHAPGGGGLLHVAAKARFSGGCGCHRVSHAGRCWRGGGTRNAPGFALCVKVPGDVVDGLVKARNQRGNVGCLTAGGVSRVDLLQRPAFGVALRSLGCGGAGPVAQAGCSAPGGEPITGWLGADWLAGHEQRRCSQNGQ